MLDDIFIKSRREALSVEEKYRYLDDLKGNISSSIASLGRFEKSGRYSSIQTVVELLRIDLTALLVLEMDLYQ